MTKKRNRTGVAAVIVSLLLLALLTTVAAARPQAERVAAAAQPKAATVTITLAPTKDNTLYQSEAGNISNGIGQHLFAGTTGNSAARRAVVAFDLSSIPTNATVTSASLSLNMSKTIAGETAVTVHSLAQDWGEGASDALGEEGGGAAAETGDATWLFAFFNTTGWTSAGGDFGAALATTPVAGTGRYDWSSAELTADVQDKVANPANNFGWLLLGDEAEVSTAKRFDSVQNSEPANRPALTVTYEAPDVEMFQAYAPVILRE